MPEVHVRDHRGVRLAWSQAATTSAVLALIVVLSAAPALGQPTGATMTCEPSSQTAAPGTSVTLDLFLEDVVDVRSYQATTRPQASAAAKPAFRLGYPVQLGIVINDEG